MPIIKTRSGWKIKSYATGKLLKRTYKTRMAAERAAANIVRRKRKKSSFIMAAERATKLYKKKERRK